MKLHEIIIGLFVSVALFTAAFLKWIPNSWTEILAFVTGGWCVYMVVRENIWNFPLGIVNNIFFAILFFESKLFSDMSLQFVYLVLGAIGWYWWLHGGENKSALPIGKASIPTVAICVVFVGVFTFAQLPLLHYLGGNVPLFDALTTSICLAAQFLLNRKKIENWYFWIVADLIYIPLYIPLYISRGLYLTALLYGVLLIMCLAGIAEWRRRMSNPEVDLGSDEPLAKVPPIALP